jgi:ADP-heptose:LPS heptosyltransferase
MWHFLFYLRLQRFDVVLQTIHSRTVAQEKFVSMLWAKEIWGVQSDTVNMPEEARAHYEPIYNRKFIPLPAHYFEFLRNKHLMEQVLDIKIGFSAPFFSQESIHTKKYIVVFAGAGTHPNHAPRRWSPQNYATLICKIIEKYPTLQVYLVGAKQEISIASIIIEHIPTQYHQKLQNWVGKTSLPDLVELIGEATLLLTNDTSAYHVGASCKTPTLCFSNGNHYGRFNPYPAEMNLPTYTLYPPNIAQSTENQDIIAQKYAITSTEDIQSITPELAYEYAQKLLNI